MTYRNLLLVSTCAILAGGEAPATTVLSARTFSVQMDRSLTVGQDGTTSLSGRLNTGIALTAPPGLRFVALEAVHAVSASGSTGALIPHPDWPTHLEVKTDGAELWYMAGLPPRLPATYRFHMQARFLFARGPAAREVVPLAAHAVLPVPGIKDPIQVLHLGRRMAAIQYPLSSHPQIADITLEDATGKAVETHSGSWRIVGLGGEEIERWDHRYDTPGLHARQQFDVEQDFPQGLRLVIQVNLGVHALDCEVSPIDVPLPVDPPMP